MKTAIVILNWNGAKILATFLPSIIKYTDTNNAQIYIADNASIDNSLNFIESNYPEIKILALDNNYGFAEGYNKALDKIDAEYFLLINSDVEVSEYWLNPLVDFMDAKQNYAACMPKIISYTNKKQFEYSGACGGYIDKYGFPFCRGRIFSNTEIDNAQYDTLKDVFWTTGACMLIRSNVFNKVKGFDKDFFAHMEEIDLCWRIQRMGYKLACVPESTVYHLGGGTLNNNSPDKLYLNFRNNLFMLHKNLPDKNFGKIMFRRKIFDGMAAMQYLISLKFNYFKAVLKANKDYKKSIIKLDVKRKELQEISKTEVKHIYPKSIVIKFYSRFKKLKFSDLRF